MNLIIDILKILWTTMSQLLSAIIDVLIANIPNILAIKKITGYFTPVGIIGLYLGVPSFVIGISIALLKKVISQK